MTKALLTNINSVWGTIINTQSSNTYRNIVSFATPELKKQFIDKELFEGKDYLQLLAAQPKIALTQNTANLAQFRVNPDDYKDETFNSLLNKDFAIIEENGQIRYYTLVGERSGSIITYTADLDIFFTYDIKEIFNNKDINIVQAHIDRFYKNDKGTLLSIIQDKSLIENSSIYQKESFDISGDNLIPFKKGKITYDIDYDSIIEIEDSENIANAADLEEMKQMGIEYLNNLTWEIVALIDQKWFDLSDGVEAPEYVQFKNYLPENLNDGSRYPYILFTTPVSPNKDFSTDKYLIENIENDYRNFNTGFTTSHSIGITQSGLQHTSVLKNSLKILPISPLVLLDPKDSNVPNFGPFKLKIKILPFSSSQNYKLSFIHLFNSSKGKTLNTVLGSRSTDEYVPGFAITKPWNIINDWKTNLKKSELSNILLDINNKVNLNYETKAELSPYRNISFNWLTNNKKQIAPEFLINNDITGKMNNGYILENSSYFININDYYDIYNVDDIESSGYQIEDIANFSLPTDTNEYSEYIIRNKSQQNTSLLNSAVSGGLGLLGAVAAPFTGGTSAALTIGALTSVAANSAMNINSQLARRKDIKNTPNKINSSGSTFSLHNQYKPNLLNIWEYKLPPQELKLIQQHFYQYGSAIGEEYKDINSILDTRYYFNYIEASKSFENIKLQASAEIKQVISDTLESGVTIWHVRDLATFKGIKNYEYENVEMSLITSQKVIK